MSIFRESFPNFVQEELKGRQDGIATRDPKFIQQLNTRAAWVRLTSGVDYEGDNRLASRYVLQGGVLNNVLQGNVSDALNGKLRSGLGGDGTNSYDTFSPGGTSHRLGIRPMPGITNVSIQSRGAYGSIQEATVSFIAWDIKQLEELEILYMRPGYTVLLEFGWDYANYSYDILSKVNGIPSINDAYADIYKIIEQSKGNYDALLGYVKNYNWSARDDGGYDCTTTIISLGEVLESLKCNWVPMDTQAFSNKGVGVFSKYIEISDNKQQELYESILIEAYEKGIIPGLLTEIYKYAYSTGNDTLVDPLFPDTTYELFTYYNFDVLSKDNRQGYPKPLGADTKTEVFMTLGSFCDLLNNYVLLKNQNNKPLAQVVTYETDTAGNPIKVPNTFTKDGTKPGQKRIDPYAPFGTGVNTSIPVVTQVPKLEIPKSLQCIASPFSISTNMAVCFVRNDYWAGLEVKNNQDEKAQEKEQTTETPIKSPGADVIVSLNAKSFESFGPFQNNVRERFTSKIVRPKIDDISAKDLLSLPLSAIKKLFFSPSLRFNGNLAESIEGLAQEIESTFEKIEVKKGKTFATLSNGNTFPIDTTGNTTTINFLDYYYQRNRKTGESLVGKTSKQIELLYDDLFKDTYVSSLYLLDPFENGLRDDDKTRKNPWTRKEIISLLTRTFTKRKPSKVIVQKLQSAQAQAIQEAAAEAAQTPGITYGTLPFLSVDASNTNVKTLGNISNIYVNLNFLYSQAVSRNLAANDIQNKNNISIREYLQGILKQIQNSLGNINDFDIQVDVKSPIGRIVDLNFTGNPNQKLFRLQIHNTNSVVRRYSFESKIFPEMGSIIAISAQDATGIGKLGYDNATLVAWNEGIKDRLIPKKDFSAELRLSEEQVDGTFILPFITKMYYYFQAIGGKNPTGNENFNYSGLDFAFRDFLAKLSRYDQRNNFKAIIPTELTVTLDGIAGIVIGNIFTINQDIVPKSYKGTKNRPLAYIVSKLGHTISGNDWITELKAYPIIFENPIGGKDVGKQWDKQEYPGVTTITVGGKPVARFATTSISARYLAVASDEPEFANKVRSVAKNIGVSELDLVTVMYKETAGTLDPSTTNNIGCIGLIQFCPDSPGGNIKTIGSKKYSLSNLRSMSRVQQLDVVEAYYKSLGFSSSKPRTIADLYLATFYPAAIGKPGNYIIGSDSSSTFPFKIAEQNPAIARYSKATIKGIKVIDVNAVLAFITS